MLYCILQLNNKESEVGMVSNYVLTLPLKTQRYQEDILNKKFEECRKIYNCCLDEILKRYKHMKESKEYRKVCKLPKGKDRNKQFNKLNKKYNLTEYSLHTYVKPMAKYFNVDAMTGQKLASRVYLAFEKLMFHTVNKVNFIGHNELHSIEGKSNKQGIRFKDNNLMFNKMTIPVLIKEKDSYTEMALQDNIKYCRILRKEIKGKTKFYVQLVLEGTPPIKINSETGEIKNSIGSGRVGIDIGVSTIAYSSKNEVKLLELAPNVVKIDKEIEILQRYMDRSRRSTNPNKYNENGTIKKGNRDEWIYSNNYLKAKSKRKELYRKQSETRKQDHNILANYLLNLGDKFYVETMNYKGLQRRSKKTTKNKKGKFNKKKRFGKSLANKAPSMFLTILDNKLKWNNEMLYKIDTTSVKASQYNHIEDEFIKKELKERWNYFNIDNKEIKIQRDCYSAFLIMNVNVDLKSINRSLCFEEFDSFKKLHDVEIFRLINLKESNKLLSSMGI